MPNVRKHAIFLDTQCQLYSLCLQAIAHKTPLDRMPMPIGDFISRRVYANRLKSQHSIHDRSSCRFVDIKQGKEAKVGHSFKVCSYTFLSSFLHESMFDRTWKKRTTLCASRRRFTSKGRPTQGNWPRYRIEGRVVDNTSPVIKGLPLNFYDPDWFLELDSEQREQLRYKPAVKLEMSNELLE